MIRLAIVSVSAFLALAMAVSAHEVRPAYLQIVQEDAERYALMWKMPIGGPRPARLDVLLPESCRDTAPLYVQIKGAFRIERRQLLCTDGLAGKEIRIEGLDLSQLETIIRVVSREGLTQTARMMANRATFTVTAPSSLFGVAAVYVRLGVDHILLGFDHLCFVAALLLLIRGFRRLVLTITAFTAAHSLTLALAVTGFITLPPGPVEALIALSILLIATEALVQRRGHPSPTAERPWTVALGFGLLHGLGFAGALTQTGLPQDAIAPALVFFNIGVELGQLAFVAALLSLGWVVSRLAGQVSRRGLETAAAYGIGSLAAYWTIDRVVGLVS